MTPKLLALLAALALAGAPRAATAPHVIVPRPAVWTGGGDIPVAFVLTEWSTVIDFAGPWEVFQDTEIPGGRGFTLYTVSDDRRPIHATGGLTIIPQYTFADAPRPRVVVIGAQSGHSPAMLEWLRRQSRQADVVMSVCTGSSRLAMAGLLSGKPATIHHDFYDDFARRYPDIQVLRGRRFVQSDPVISTAGGLSSGIDLALHVVDVHLGRAVAQATADRMEYEGTGWKRETGQVAVHR
jgi:transcriptional regulator GlxA family with amidase domain